MSGVTPAASRGVGDQKGAATVTTMSGNGNGGPVGLRAWVAALITLGCAAALALGGLTASGAQAAARSAMGAGARPCIYADVLGVPGEGCGDKIAVTTSACVYASVADVPGEGCDPARP